jgi:hypothetical protein
MVNVLRISAENNLRSRDYAQPAPVLPEVRR